MKKKTISAVLLGLMGAMSAFAVGRFQNEDMRSEAEIVSRGGSVSQLTNDTKIWVTGNGILKRLDQAITDGDLSGGGSGIDTSDSQWTLFTSEAGGSLPRALNQLLDNYNTSRGTLTDVSVAGSRLSLSPGETAGSQERVKQVTGNVQMATGVTNIAAQALAPKATTIAANTVIFEGDICEFFPTSRPAAFMKEFTSDTELVHQYLRNPSNNIALLSASSCSYAPGPDESSLVVANPDALDLDFDLLAAAYPANLRVVPFDYQLNAKATAAAVYTPLALKDANTTGTIRIPAESLVSPFEEIGALAGTVLAQKASCSPSGAYCFAEALIETGASDTWQFAYSTDSGANWTVFATTKNAVDSVADEYGGNYQRISKKHIVVGDNGKVFALYASDVGGNDSLNGVYTDLTAGTPVLSDTAATGVDAFNNTGTAGIIAVAGAGAQMSGQVVANSDLSSVIVLIVNEASSTNNVALRVYSAGGATHAGLNTADGIDTDAGDPYSSIMYGAGASERVIFFANSGTNVNQFTYDPPFTGAASSSGSINGGVNKHMRDVAVQGARGHIFYTDPGASNILQYQPFVAANTPTFGSISTVTATTTTDLFAGYNSASIPNASFKLQGQTIAINPGDENQAVTAVDMLHPDSRNRPLAMEVRNASSFIGVAISQYVQNAGSFHNFRSASTNEQLAQTFTGSSTRVRTVAVRMHQIGNIGPGYALTMEIQSTTANAPNGSVIATSTNTIDPSTISKTAGTTGEWVYFTFDSQTINTQDSFVIKATYPINGTDYLGVHDNSLNPYAGGQWGQYDGATWNMDSAYDMLFEINSEWLYGVGEEVGLANTRSGVVHQTFESTASAYNASMVSLLHRVTPTVLGTGYYPITGAPAAGSLAWGTGNTASTVVQPQFSGYDVGFDEAISFNTQCGVASSSSTKNRQTGALDANQRCEDRSYYATPTSSTNNVTTTADGDFESGTSVAFNGTNSNYAYINNVGVSLLGASVYSINAEVKVTALPGGLGFIYVYGNGTSTNGGIYLGVNNTGQIQCGIFSLAASLTSSTISTNVKYDIRCEATGTLFKIYVNDVEQPYSSQTGPSTTVVAPSTADSIIVLGAGSNNSNNLAMRLGKFRLTRGTSAPVSDTYVYQAPITNLYNLGQRAFAGQWSGQNANAVGTNFRDMGSWLMFGAGAPSVVDSYEDTYQWNGNLPTAGDLIHYRLDLGRGSDRNQSGVYGTNVRYFKR